MLYFAYGSNMSRALMRIHCATAEAVGRAALAGWRFIITRDGVGSIVPRRGAVLEGVLWRLSPRDLAALNAYEGVDFGLYVRRTLVVRAGSRRLPALIYISPRRGIGRPRPGYIALVVEAAREWDLPEAYSASLARWSPSRWRGAPTKDTGDLG
jgi:hypothetical protein